MLARRDAKASEKANTDTHQADPLPLGEYLITEAGHMRDKSAGTITIILGVRGHVSTSCLMADRRQM